MIFREVLPDPILAPLVDNVRLVNFSAIDVGVKPYPARIEHALVFFARGFIKSHNLASGEKRKISRNALLGQQVGRLNFETHCEDDFLMIEVIFKPGGLHRLLGLPLHELTNQYIDAEDLLGNRVQQVNDLIANADNYDDMIKYAEHFLISLSKKVDTKFNGVDELARLMLEQPLGYSLDWLADQANLSPRQFERKFVAHAGIGPKLFTRINRFFRALQYKESHPGTDWLTVALLYGYTDYYHLCKDCKQFTHVTPNIVFNQQMYHPRLLPNIISRNFIKPGTKFHRLFFSE